MADPLQIDVAGRRDPFDLGPATAGKLGMWVFLVTDAMSFSGLLLTYGVARAASPDWPDPTKHLGVNFTALMTFVLICSSVSMVMALSAARARDRRGLTRWLAATILGGLFFLGGQAFEWRHLVHEGMTLSGDAFAAAGHGDARFCSTFFAVTGFHGLHVLTGVLYLAAGLARAARGRYTDGAGDANPVEVAGLFWHFVDLVWILVFTFIYLI